MLRDTDLVAYVIIIGFIFLQCKNLQSTLRLITRELKSTEQRYSESLKKQYSLEEEILSMRKNYTEQVEVLSEQIVLLSHQLALQ